MRFLKNLVAKIQSTKSSRIPLNEDTVVDLGLYEGHAVTFKKSYAWYPRRVFESRIFTDPYAARGYTLNVTLKVFYGWVWLEPIYVGHDIRKIVYGEANLMTRKQKTLVHTQTEQLYQQMVFERLSK